MASLNQQVTKLFVVPATLRLVPNTEIFSTSTIFGCASKILEWFLCWIWPICKSSTIYVSAEQCIDCHIKNSKKLDICSKSFKLVMHTLFLEHDRRYVRQWEVSLSNTGSQSSRQILFQSEGEGICAVMQWVGKLQSCLGLLRTLPYWVFSDSQHHGVYSNKQKSKIGWWCLLLWSWYIYGVQTIWLYSPTLVWVGTYVLDPQPSPHGSSQPCTVVRDLIW